MKKIFLVAVLAVLTALPLSKVNAQSWGVGVVGGFDYGLQVKKYMGGTSLDFRGHLHNYGFQVAGLYEWNQSLGNDFTLYYGFGAGLGSWKVSEHHDAAFGLDIEAIVGVEWKIPSIPFAISFDYRPAFEVLPEVGFYAKGFAFGIKYLF